MSGPYMCFITISAEYWARVSTSMVDALLVGADHLVGPPLVAELVGADVGDHVDPRRDRWASAMKPMPSDQGTVLAKDWANWPCGVGELQEPHLAELVGAEVGLVVVERRLRPRWIIRSTFQACCGS